MVAREMKSAKEMSSASKQVTENVKRTAELNRLEAEVGITRHQGITAVLQSGTMMFLLQLEAYL